MIAIERLPPLKDVESYLDSQASRLAGSFINNPKGGTPTRPPVWRIGFISRGYAALIRAAGYEEPPLRLLAAWDELAAQHNEVTGWPTQAPDGRIVSEPSNDGLAALAVAVVAAVMPKVDFSTYLGLGRRACHRYLDWIEEENGHVFMRSRIDGRTEPYNHIHQWAAGALLVGRLCRDQELERAGWAFLRTFEALRTTDKISGTAAWAYRPPLGGEGEGRGEQIWKAISTLILPLVAADVDEEYKEHFRRTYVPTFLSRVYEGHDEMGVPRFQMFIGNAKRRPLERERIRTESRRHRVQTLAEWALLGRFDPQVDEVIVDAVEQRKDLFPHGWFGSWRSVLGLADLLSRNC